MLSKDRLQFLDDLKANNNRDWFLDNKKRYEVFKKDYQQLVGDFLDAMKPLDPSLEMLEVKNCTFRINRDIRFSKDKSPYKDHLGIWMSSGAKGKNRSGYYVHIEKGKSFIAGGLYCPESDDLKKMRKEMKFSRYFVSSVPFCGQFFSPLRLSVFARDITYFCRFLWLSKSSSPAARSTKSTTS